MPPVMRERPAAKVRKAWKKLIETLRPERKQDREKKELDIAKKVENEQLEDVCSGTTLSSYASTLRTANEGEEEDYIQPAFNYDEDTRDALKEEHMKETEGDQVEDITALPPIPPRPIVQPRGPAKLRKKRTIVGKNTRGTSSEMGRLWMTTLRYAPMRTKRAFENLSRQKSVER